VLDVAAEKASSDRARLAFRCDLPDSYEPKRSAHRRRRSDQIPIKKREVLRDVDGGKGGVH
jgi:hypothetical protein